MYHEPTVFLADDDEAVRDALSISLQEAGFAVETFASGKEFLRAYQSSRPGCLLMDLCMPDLSGLAVQEELINRDIQIPVIFMTGYGTIRDSVAAIKAGALDFLEKPFSRTLLLDRVGEAIELDRHRRGASCAQTAAKAHQADAKSHYERLSPRESEVMSLISAGNSSKQIARLLGISPRTVDAHRARLMVKMQVSSLAELGALFTLCSTSFDPANPAPCEAEHVPTLTHTAGPEPMERANPGFARPESSGHRYPELRRRCPPPPALSLERV